MFRMEVSDIRIIHKRFSIIILLLKEFVLTFFNCSSALLQKNRISRLRSTTERKTRLDHLRKGGPRGRKSIQPGQTSSNQNSDEEKEVVTKKRKRKHIKAKYYKGSKKRIKQKGIKSTSGEEDGGYADPTISYVFIQGLGENLNDEEEIKAGLVSRSAWQSFFQLCFMYYHFWRISRISRKNFFCELST